MSWKEIGEMSKQFIQKELYNNKKEPFTNCSDCKNDLDGGYRIFKSYSRFSLEERHKLILELALCESCFETYSKEVSKTTISKLKELQQEYPNIGSINIHIEFLFGLDSGDITSCCEYTKKTVSELKDYQVSALCYKDKQITPLSILGDEGLKAYQDCTSEETQDYMGDFINRIIDLPPEIENLIKDGSFVLI